MEDMEFLVENGINSFKTVIHYLHNSYPSILDDKGVIDVMNQCKKLKCIILVHCENGELVRIGQKNILLKGITGFIFFK
jgi:hypothetical protein